MLRPAQLQGIDFGLFWAGRNAGDYSIVFSVEKLRSV